MADEGPKLPVFGARRAKVGWCIMSIRPKVSLVILLFYTINRSRSDYLTSTQVELTSSLVKNFHASYCIYVIGESFLKFWPVSNATDQINFFVSVWTLDQLEEYMENAEFGEKRSGKSAVVLKADETSLECLRKISRKMSISRLTWLMYSDKTLDDTQLDGIYIPYDCEFIHVNPRGEIYLLTEIYRIARSSKLEAINYGYWSKENGLFVHEDFFYRRRTTLKSQVLSAFMGNEPPYIVYRGILNGKPEFSGYFFEVWKELEQRINIGVKLSEQNMNKKFHLDDIHHVDVAVVPIAYDSSTLDHMDITHPIYESRAYLFGHRPGTELEWDSYLKPFDAQTWWVSLGWMTCSSAALAVMYKIAWTYGTSETEAEYFIFTFTESLATVFRAMCMQGSDVTPKSNSCRLLFLSIYLTALVVSSAFSAALFSLLTIPTARAPFTSFEQVITNKAFKIGLIEDSEIHQMLQEYTLKYPTSIQNKLLEKTEMSRNRNPRTLLEGLNSVCRSKTYVMMSDLPFVLHSMQNMTRDCQEKIMPAGPILLKTFIGFGLKKGSPYKEIIDLHILSMRNEGIIHRLLHNNWPPPIPSVQATWVRVTLADISPILYMFCMGAVLAIAFLIVEKLHFLVFRRGRSNGRKKNSSSGAALAKSLSRFSSKNQVVSRSLEMKLKHDEAKDPAKLANVHVHDFWH